jgi:hypothetical protein
VIIASDHHEWVEALNESRTGILKNIVVCKDCRLQIPIRDIQKAPRCPVIKQERWSSGFTDMTTGKHIGSEKD